MSAQVKQIQTTLQYSLTEFEKMDNTVTRKGQWLGSYSMGVGMPKLSLLPRDVQIRMDTSTQTQGETLSRSTTSGLSFSSSEENYQFHTGYMELLSENETLGEKVTARLLTKSFNANLAFSKPGVPSFSLSVLSSKNRDLLTSAGSETVTYQSSLRHSFGRLTLGASFTASKQTSGTGNQAKSSDIGMEASYIFPIEQHTTTIFGMALQRTQSRASTSLAKTVELNILSQLLPYLSLTHRFSLQQRNSKTNDADNQVIKDEMTGLTLTLGPYSLLRFSYHSQKQKLPAEEISTNDTSLSADFTPGQDFSLFVNYSAAEKSPQGSILIWTHAKTLSASANMKVYKKSNFTYSILRTSAREDASSSISQNVSLLTEIFSNRLTTLTGLFNKTWQEAKAPSGAKKGAAQNIGLTLLFRPDSRTSYSFTLTSSLSKTTSTQEDVLFSGNVSKALSQKLNVGASYARRMSTVKDMASLENITQDTSLFLSLQADARTNINLRLQFTRNNQASFKEYRSFTFAFNTSF